MDGQNSYGWTSLALAGLREALSLWESVANIDFGWLHHTDDAETFSALVVFGAAVKRAEIVGFCTGARKRAASRRRSSGDDDATS